MDVASPARLSTVPPRDASRAHRDERVRAAARVLAGESPEQAAEQAGVDVEQVLRWADALAAGGAATVAGVGVERPTAGPWASNVPVEDFLQVVAHELRTPLTAARSGLRVLGSDVPAAVRARVAGTVLDRLAQLDRLTENLLETVAVTTGRARLRPERVDLTGAVAGCCAELGLAFAPAAPLAVVVDPARLRTIVAALLGHALRYADPHAVEVRVQALTDAGLLTIRLDGVRLDPELAQAQLEPFGAAGLEPFSAAARGDGNGLALYVARALAVASAGALGVAGSAAATVFWLRLPLPESPVPPPRQERP